MSAKSRLFQFSKRFLQFGVPASLVVLNPLQARCKASHNRVLGDISLPGEQRPHRVALCEWPADQCKHNGDSRTASLDALFAWVQENGYDGVEMTVTFFQKYLPNMSLEDVARRTKEKADEYGMQIFGANIWWVFDFEGQDWEKCLGEYRQQARCIKIMGGEYLTFQMWLSPEYIDTCGLYRRDREYLQHCCDRIEDLHALCEEEGINCYIETHVARISEDVEGFNKIMDMCNIDFEVNGDLSHFLYRNLRADTPEMMKILKRVNHMHQRMCRPHGDLSAEVQDPDSDWKMRGLTWNAFAFSKHSLDGGLSSRVICGESGPAHLVTDPLTQDAKLVSLYRLMARYADASARGEPFQINSPTDVPLAEPVKLVFPPDNTAPAP